MVSRREVLKAGFALGGLHNMSNPLPPIESETRVALTFGEETDNVLRDQISEAMLDKLSEAMLDKLSQPSKLNTEAAKAMSDYTRSMMGLPPQ